MLEFLQQNAGTIIVCAVLVAIVTLIIVRMLRKKKRGESSCGCACSGCPMTGSCHTPNGEQDR